MKQLILLRHAKSDWGDARTPDFDRPLASRGEAAAAAIGELLVEQGFHPQRILCSSARRTRETLARLGAAAVTGAEVVYEDRLYLAEPATILRVIAEQPAKTDRLVVIGHNPGTEQLALQLAERKHPDYDRMAKKFPTAAFAWYEVDAKDWPAIAGKTRLKRFVVPRDLDD